MKKFAILMFAGLALSACGAEDEPSPPAAAPSAASQLAGGYGGAAAQSGAYDGRTGDATAASYSALYKDRGHGGGGSGAAGYNAGAYNGGNHGE